MLDSSYFSLDTHLTFLSIIWPWWLHFLETLCRRMATWALTFRFGKFGRLSSPIRFVSVVWKMHISSLLQFGGRSLIVHGGRVAPSSCQNLSSGRGLYRIAWFKWLASWSGSTSLYLFYWFWCISIRWHLLLCWWVSNLWRLLRLIILLIH